MDAVLIAPVLSREEGGGWEGEVTGWRTREKVGDIQMGEGRNSRPRKSGCLVGSARGQAREDTALWCGACLPRCWGLLQFCLAG